MANFFPMHDYEGRSDLVSLDDMVAQRAREKLWSDLSSAFGALRTALGALGVEINDKAPFHDIDLASLSKADATISSVLRVCEGACYRNMQHYAINQAKAKVVNAVMEGK